MEIANDAALDEFLEIFSIYITPIRALGAFGARIKLHQASHGFFNIHGLAYNLL